MLRSPRVSFPAVRPLLSKRQTAASSMSEQQPQGSSLPPELLKIIRGETTAEEKNKQYEKSLDNWWKEYSDRKHDEKEEYIANSLLYDRNHLPRIAPPPTHETVKREEEERRRAAQAAREEEAAAAAAEAEAAEGKGKEQA